MIRKAFVEEYDLYYLNEPTTPEIIDVLEGLEGEGIACTPISTDCLCNIEDILHPFTRFKEKKLVLVGIDNIYFLKDRKNELEVLGVGV